MAPPSPFIPKLLLKEQLFIITLEPPSPMSIAPPLAGDDVCSATLSVKQVPKILKLLGEVLLPPIRAIAPPFTAMFLSNKQSLIVILLLVPLINNPPPLPLLILLFVATTTLSKLNVILFPMASIPPPNWAPFVLQLFVLFW